MLKLFTTIQNSIFRRIAEGFLHHKFVLLALQRTR